MKPPAVSRYLCRRAATGPWHITGAEGRDYAAAVVIPALAESSALPATLDSLAANPAETLVDTLILVVVNQRPDSSSADKQDNQRTLRQLENLSRQQTRLQLAWVDASGPERELPMRDGGVGLARKIGFDLALQRLDFQHSDPLLIALDADTLVRDDYLPRLRGHFQNSPHGATVVPFQHRPGTTPAHHQAIVRYELFLRAHVLGLELARSPYAFHTVGSTMACRAEAYVKAGGMNRRRAGEDFYFLQQLAKTAGVAPLQGTLVYPSARISARTPFGTGRSVGTLLAGDAEAVLFYPAACYGLLGDWLELVDSHLTEDGATLLSRARRQNQQLGTFLEQENFPDLWDRIGRNHQRRQARRKAFHGWFDGLKTTRLIHHLCATLHPRGHPQTVLPALLHQAGLEAPHCPEEQLYLLRRYQSAVP